MYGLISNSVPFYVVLFEKREAFSCMLGLQQILYIVVQCYLHEKLSQVPGRQPNCD